MLTLIGILNTFRESNAGPDAGNALSPVLVKRAQSGDRRALDEFCKQIKPAVYRQCLSFFEGDSENATNAMSEALIKVSSGLQGFRGEAKVTTWVYRITHRACLDHKEKLDKVIQRETPLDDETEALVDAGSAQMRQSDAGRQALSNIRLQDMKRELRLGLGERNYEICILRLEGKMTPPEIAQMFGMTLEQYNNLLHKTILKTSRKILEKYRSNE